jgi:hypothetical protein
MDKATIDASANIRKIFLDGTTLKGAFEERVQIIMDGSAQVPGSAGVPGTKFIMGWLQINF